VILKFYEKVVEAFEDQQEKEENFREEQQDKAKKSNVKRWRSI